PDTVFRGFTSPITGPANTAGLAAFGNGPSPAPYRAARACDELTASGHSDWYLPAFDELYTLYWGAAYGTANGFSGSASYWTSTESDANTARKIGQISSSPSVKARTDSHVVRCVRRGG
ncbi:MAG: DUF1566 domain-containing protein, partial [Alphaproteobacteria bacterium]|nr:DUF1566 domain-containing protein [Alphaproteobacteria bacterium]